MKNAKKKPTAIDAETLRRNLTELDRRVFDRLKKLRAKNGSTKTSFGIYADETCTKFSPEFRRQLDENFQRFVKDADAMWQRIFSPEEVAKARERIEKEQAATPPADAQG